MMYIYYVTLFSLAKVNCKKENKLYIFDFYKFRIH